MAKPIVRTRRASPAVVRRDGPKPAEPAKVDESTQRNLAVAANLRSPRLPGDGGADGARLKFLSGPKAGQAVALTRERTTIGRAGVQLVAIERSGEGYRLRPVEGEPTPVNGRPATARWRRAGSRGCRRNSRQPAGVRGRRRRFGQLAGRRFDGGSQAASGPKLP